MLLATEHDPYVCLNSWPRKANRFPTKEEIQGTGSDVNIAQAAREQSKQLCLDDRGRLLRSDSWSGRLSERTVCLSWALENKSSPSPGGTEIEFHGKGTHVQRQEK